MSYGVEIITGADINTGVYKVSVLADAVWTADIDTILTPNYSGTTTGLSFEGPAGAHQMSRGPQGQIIYYKNINVSSGKVEINYVS